MCVFFFCSTEINDCSLKYVQLYLRVGEFTINNVIMTLLSNDYLPNASTILQMGFCNITSTPKHPL